MLDNICRQKKLKKRVSDVKLDIKRLRRDDDKKGEAGAIKAACTEFVR